MDRKKLYSIFHMHGHIHNGEWAIAPRKEGALLDAIAQAHEQDKWDALQGVDAAWHEIEDGHLATIASLEARAAMMADCLKWLDDHHAASHGAWHDDAEEYSEERNNQVLDTIQQILQSAPKVLFSLRLMEGHGGGIGVGHRRYASDENEWPWVAIDLSLIHI